MEAHERDRIRELAQNHFDLRKLYDEHQEFERRLSRFENRRFLTAPEQQEAKQLKIKKLRGVDRMMRILSEESLAA